MQSLTLGIHQLIHSQKVTWYIEERHTVLKVIFVEIHIKPDMAVNAIYKHISVQPAWMAQRLVRLLELYVHYEEIISKP